MRMRQKHAVDVRRVERELLVVVLADALGTLEHAAVNQIAVLPCLQQIAGTRDCMSRT